jgi:hypothetical protein
MIDPVGGKLYTFANSTWGAQICWERLNEQVCIHRMLRGSAVIPLAKLDKRPMPTSRGMQSRPHLEPTEWREPRGSLSLTPQPPAPQLPSPATAAAAPDVPTAAPTDATPAATQAPPVQAAATTSLVEAIKPVKPIPIEEVINDSLPPWA